MQAVFYASAIIYPLSVITGVKTKELMVLNPVAQIIQDARYLLVTRQTETVSTVYQNGFMRAFPISIVIIALAFGVYVFRKNSKTFAEDL